MTEPTATPAPPPPLDSPTLTDPLQCPELQWGILGCGRVSHDFCRAVTRHVPTACIVACATANSMDRAQAFAQTFDIAAAYGDYAALVADPRVQVVYVGTVHSFRREIGEMCLLAGKHVLLEKPFACKVEDAEYLIQLAKERNLFLQEGMWTRFFPAVEKARQIVMQDKLLGEVVAVMTDFNFNASDSEIYPGERCSWLMKRRTIVVGDCDCLTVYLCLRGQIRSFINENLAAERHGWSGRIRLLLSCSFLVVAVTKKAKVTMATADRTLIFPRRFWSLGSWIR
jgi:predicted dehydrogenase